MVILVQPPKIMSPMQPIHAIEGGPVKLQCNFHGDGLKVKWYAGDKDITNNRNIQVKVSYILVLV